METSPGTGLAGASARRPSLGTLIQLAGDGFLGIASLLLATRPSGQGGLVTFAGSGWRYVLGGLGLLFALLFVRLAYRLATGYQPRPDAENLRRARTKGKLVAIVGAWFVALALVPPLAERTISFSPWLKVGYGLAGGLNVLVGLVVQWDPTRHLRRERVRVGDGVRGRARILRAADTGVLINEAPRVKIDFLIQPEGMAPYEASDTMVMQQAKLALLLPGATVGAIIDRDDPRVFHLDWDDWRAPLSPGPSPA